MRQPQLQAFCRNTCARDSHSHHCDTVTGPRCILYNCVDQEDKGDTPHLAGVSHGYFNLHNPETNSSLLNPLLGWHSGWASTTLLSAA